MKKFLLILLFGLFTSNAFSFSTGKFYSYSVKESGGDKQMNFYYFTESSEKVHFYNDFSSLAPFVFIGLGDYDQNYHFFSHTYAYNPFSYMALPYNKTSEMTYDIADKSVLLDVSYFNKGGKEKQIKAKRKVDIIPSYETTLYQLDLWLFLQDYNGDYSSFEVGGMMNGRSFTNTVTFEGKENINNEMCQVWKINENSFFGNTTQKIYIREKDKAVVLYTNSGKIQPVGKLEMALLEVKDMTKEEWDNFVKDTNENRRIKLNFPLSK